MYYTNILIYKYLIINVIYQIQIIKKNVICNTMQSGTAKYCCLIERIYTYIAFGACTLKYANMSK